MTPKPSRWKFARIVTKKINPDDEPDDSPSIPRKGKRVTWQPDGNPGNLADSVPESVTAANYGESELSNDERLKGDKPPHWG